MYREVKFGNDVRSKILEGINIVADAVTSTLGPRGTNVVYSEGEIPVVTKDGVTVAQNVFVEDKFQNMGVMMAREAAEATNRKAGDGTTGTIAILRSVVNEGNKYIVAGLNPVLIKRGIDLAVSKIIDELESTKRELTTREEKENIATISANNDSVLGKMIVDVIESVGKNGVITVTNGNTLDNDVEYVSGMKLFSGYEDQIFINNQKRLTCNLDNPLIVVSSDRITQQSQLIPVIQKLLESGKKEMVLFAESIEQQALVFLIQNYLQGKFTCVPVKLPAFSGYNEDIALDMAALVGANVVGEGRVRRLADTTIEDFGECESIIVSREYSIVSGGKGDIEERIDNINSLLDEEKDPYKIEKLKDRLGRVNGKIANIKVGGSSPTEQREIKDRIEDSLNSTRYAIEEGIVEGAGTALLRISEKINTDSDVAEIKAGFDIVKKSICAPFKKIILNGGENADAIMGSVLEKGIGYNSLTNKYVDLFEDGIIDSKRVIYNEVLNGCSTAGTILTSSVGIVSVIKDK